MQWARTHTEPGGLLEFWSFSSEFRGAKAARIHKAEYQRKELKRSLEFRREFFSNLQLGNDWHTCVRKLSKAREGTSWKDQEDSPQISYRAKNSLCSHHPVSKDLTHRISSRIFTRGTYWWDSPGPTGCSGLT